MTPDVIAATGHGMSCHHSVLPRFAVAFLTDIRRRGADLTTRRVVRVRAAIGWLAVIHWTAGEGGELENRVLAYAAGVLAGLLGREYQRAEPR